MSVVNSDGVPCDSQVETALQPIVLVSAVQVPVALQQECRQTVGRLRVGLVPLMLTKHGIGTGGQIRECQREESRGVPRSAGRDAYAVRCGLEKKNGLTLFTPARSNQRR